jgi:hypothetical protein
MNGQYTQGRLNYAYMGKMVGGGGVRYCNLVVQPQPGVAITVASSALVPDARRLVACWNACEGLSQDALDGGWTAAGLSSYAKSLEGKYQRESVAHSQTIRDRDQYHEWADKLAEAIAKHFGAEIGEHSSANCPWAKALEVIENGEPAALVETVEPVALAQVAAKGARHVDSGEAMLGVGVSGTDDGVQVAVHLKSGGITTVLYSQGHPFGKETLGLVALPRGLVSSPPLQPGSERDAALRDLLDFKEGQWWVKELDEAVSNGTDDQKRAVAVVRHMLRVAAMAAQQGEKGGAA